MSFDLSNSKKTLNFLVAYIEIVQKYSSGQISDNKSNKSFALDEFTLEYYLKCVALIVHDACVCDV